MCRRHIGTCRVRVAACDDAGRARRLEARTSQRRCCGFHGIQTGNIRCTSQVPFAQSTRCSARSSCGSRCPHPSRSCISQPRKWPDLLARAAQIVNSYDALVTAAAVVLSARRRAPTPHAENADKSLWKHTVKARRKGTFPVLMDRGRTIHRNQTFASPAQALDWLCDTTAGTGGPSVVDLSGRRKGGYRRAAR